MRPINILTLKNSLSGIVSRTIVHFDFFCCLPSSIIRFLLFSCFFFWSIVDSLPEGSHCSFEKGSCGWTLNETAASAWSIKGFNDMIHSGSFVGSALQSTGGRFFIVLS